MRCETCSWYETKAKGGRPAKNKRRGVKRAEASIGCAELLQHISSLVPQLPQLRSEEALDPSRLMPPPPVTLADLVCPVCTDVVDQPVETICGHMFCNQCMCKWLHTSDRPSCPCCPTFLLVKSDVKPVTRIVQSILSNLEIRCDKERCAAIVQYTSYGKHVEIRSPEDMTRVLITPVPLSIPQATSPPPTLPSTLGTTSQLMTSPLASTSGTPAATPTPSKVSLTSVIDSPLDKPPTAVELRAFTTVAKRLMNTRQGGDDMDVRVMPDLKLPTGGQV